ncbi:MAG TPA: hypothetical protein VM866_11735 [Pyrinomonadaceae bacterium]|nr:hypothetical protein [Pyrinomonadaceae bacterium]
MAETIKREIGVETELIEGGRGEFTVLVDDRVVAQKGWIKFPSDQKVLAAVRQALET